MAAFSVQECRTQLAAYLEAERAILAGGQSYTIGGRTFTRANLSEVRKGISDWEMKLSSAMKRNRPRCRGIIVHG